MNIAAYAVVHEQGYKLLTNREQARVYKKWAKKRFGSAQLIKLTAEKVIR